MNIGNVSNVAIDPTITSAGFHTQTHEAQSAVAIKGLEATNELDTNLNQEDLQEITEKLNFQMKQLDTNIRFSYNRDASTMVIQVKEATTGDLIRELPTKEALRISQYFKESIGLLFDKES